MAESPSKGKQATAKSVESERESEGELDRLADELYALRPDAFAAARDDYVSKAKADGQQALARELGKLRKPTQSAWLINLLWRDQREVMEQLFVLADELTRAQAEASGPDLQRFTAQRRQLEAALIRRAGALAGQAGVSISAAMEREAQETLSAALARPDVADEVRTGRLVKPASYAGFGSVTVAAPPARAQPTKIADEGKPRENELAERAALRARERRAEAERLVADARTALEAAAGVLAERSRDAEAAYGLRQSAHERQDEVRQQLTQLQQQLHELEAEVTTAEQAARAMERNRDQAEKTHAAAQRTLEQAEQHLTELAKVD